MSRRALTFALLLLALQGTLGPGSPLLAQEPDSLNLPPPLQEVDDTLPQEEAPGRISPRGAFLRSALVPGWGHSKVGAHVRGGFYVAMESAAAFMIFKTQTRLTRARDRLALLEEVVTARLEAEGITDPAAIEAQLAGDPEVEDLRLLEVSRAEQREDWIALSVFFLFLGGADAYVSAHLAEIPAAVSVEGNPSGGMDVGISIPLTFR